MNNTIEQLKKLKAVTPRQGWKSASRDALLRHVSNQSEAKSRVTILEYVSFIKEMVTTRVFQPAVAMLLVVGVFIGTSLTVVAAFNSRPGDSLYGTKIVLEKTQLAITPQERRAELSAELVRKRVEEIGRIVAQKDIEPKQRQEQITVAVNEFKKNVAVVTEQIERELKEPAIEEIKVKSEKTLQIASLVSSQVSELSKSIQEEELAEEEKTTLTSALEEVENIVASAVDSAASKTATSTEEELGSEEKDATSTEEELDVQEETEPAPEQETTSTDQQETDTQNTEEE